MKKSVPMATLAARYCQKNKELQSMQGFGMQRTKKKIFKPKKHEKVLPHQYLLQDIAKKAITHNFHAMHETFTPILAETRKQLPVNEQQ